MYILDPGNYCFNRFAIGTMGASMADHSRNLSNSNLVEYLNPALFATMANKEDHPTYAEALYGPYSCGFIGAMETEILTLIELKVFDLVVRKLDMKIISGVCALCRKRYPDRLIRKLKAQYCARGFELIEGYDYFETHSLVVMWMSVHLLLVRSILLNIETSK